MFTLMFEPGCACVCHSLQARHAICSRPVCVRIRHVIINSSNDEENKKKCNLEERKKNPEINVYKGINICVVVVVTSRAFCVSHVCQS